MRSRTATRRTRCETAEATALAATIEEVSVRAMADAVRRAVRERPYAWFADVPGVISLTSRGAGAAVCSELTSWPKCANVPILPVYVIHWNAPEWCLTTVRSFSSQRGVATAVTVIDNGGLDSTSEAALPLGTRVIRLNRNTGYSGGANVAISDWLANGELEFAAIACHDVELHERSAAAMLAAIRAAPVVGIMGIERGAFERPPTSPEESKPFTVRPVNFTSGACMIIRRSFAEEVGGFDETFGSYVEDVDYCYRALDQHWAVAVTVGVVARWRGRAIGNSGSPSSVNYMRLIRKRRGRGALSIRLALECAFVIRDLARLAFPSTRANAEQRLRDHRRVLLQGGRILCGSSGKRAFSGVRS